MKKLAICIPTRDRPELIELALRFLSRQDLADCEILVLDNPSSDYFCCQSVVSSYDSLPVNYVRSRENLSMVRNYNRWLYYSDAEYTCFLPDRTFFLPGAIAKLLEIIDSSGVDMCNMHPIVFYPDDLTAPATSRGYLLDGRDWNIGLLEYRPSEWWAELVQWRCGYYDHPPWLGTRGMAFFGAIKTALLHRLAADFGAVFHLGAPENTSRALLLNSANSAISISEPLLLTPHSSIGNAARLRKSYSHAESDVRTLSLTDRILMESRVLVPNLITTHNRAYAELGIMCDALGISNEQNIVNCHALIYNDVSELRASKEDRKKNLDAYKLFDEHIKRKSDAFISDFIEAKRSLMNERKKIQSEKNERIKKFPRVELSCMEGVYNYLFETGYQ